MERFTKVRNIGKGNMGACTLARNNEDGRHYVIKQVDLGKLNKKERQQSLNEAKLLSSLRHPNVINYVDSFLARKSDHLCIVMEFADGGDLSNKVKNSHGQHFPQDQVLDWAIQLALALQHITSKRILHRDVKTQNVFLTSDGLCKLGDFGIARTLNSTFDQAHTFVGTPYYLSPELILERPYDSMSDTWAFGVCLYEMMALHHPFNANDMKSLMQRILKVQYDPPPAEYSPELRQVVTRLLTKDPAQRLKLGEMLEMPIMVNRMKQWLQGGILPSRYISSLVRHKLLPPVVMAAVGGPAPQAGPGESYSTSSQFPTLPGARVPAQDQQEKPRRDRERYVPAQGQSTPQQQDPRTEFRDVRLKPKPPPGAPMPARDPSLLHGHEAPALNPPNNNAARAVRGALPSLPQPAGRRGSDVAPAPSHVPPRLAGLPNRGVPPNVPEPGMPPRGGRLQPVGQPHHLPPVGKAPQHLW